MKRALLVVTLALLFCWCASAPPKKETTPPLEGKIAFPLGWDDSVIDRIKAGESPKKRLAVLDFEGNEKLAGKVDLKMSDMLTTSLVKSNRFDVVERNKIDRVLSEQKAGLSGIIDPSTAAEVGRILGVEYVVFGSITSATRKDIDKFGYMLVQIEVGIDVRAVNTTTGKILLSESAVGRDENKVVKTADGVIVSGAIDYNAAYASAARDAVNKVGAKIADLSPLIGFVVSVSASEMRIDVGEDQGVAAGDIFVVFRVGDEILHPATGKHLGWNKEILQEVRAVSTESNMAVVEKIRSQSDKPLIPGDLVISR